MTLYPNAVFLRSYDAGRGQQYHLYGVAAPFADMVTYYRNLLKDRGNLVFEVPPTHVFEIGRFREETMAFPPSVTVKDYTFGGSAGYPNPLRARRPERFPTVLQIVRGRRRAHRRATADRQSTRVTPISVSADRKIALVADPLASRH